MKKILITGGAGYIGSSLATALINFGYKVTISGVGADELFSGYYDHHLAYLAEMKKINHQRYLNALKDWEENISSVVRNPFLKDPNYFIKDSNNRDHIYLNADFFNSLLIKHYFLLLFECSPFGMQSDCFIFR